MAKELSEKKKLMVLAGIACFTLLYVDMNYILKGQIKDLRDNSAKLGALRADVYKYKKEFSRLKSAQAQALALEEKNKDVHLMVFLESDIASFMDDVSRKAASQGIKLMNIQPQEKKGSSPTKDASIKGPAGFSPLLFKLDFSCGYHQLGGFISALEANPFITVSGLNVIASANSSKHKVSLILRVYVKK